MQILNETIETIHNRRSVREFTDQVISDDIITAVLNAANTAPSAHNQQSWRFLVVRGEKKQQLADLIYSRSFDFPKPASVLLRMACRTITMSPVVVAVANTGELIRHGTELFAIKADMAEDFFRVMEIQSSSAAVENLILAAKSLGVDSVWLGIMVLMKDQVLELLGEPQGEFMAIVPLGYAVRQSNGPRKRGLDATVKYLD